MKERRNQETQSNNLEHAILGTKPGPHTFNTLVTMTTPSPQNCITFEVLNEMINSIQVISY